MVRATPPQRLWGDAAVQQYIATEFAAGAAVFQQIAADTELAAALAAASAATIASIAAGGRVMFCGNGGSAADAMHLAGELVGRLVMERRGLPAIALSSDTSVITAIGNDYGYERVFERQVEAHGRAGDVLIGLSTSGNSANVLKAFEAARDLQMVTIGITGAKGGKMVGTCDHLLRMPSDNTQRIQEGMKLVGHTLCALVERALAN
jgi:D-sedoheptulose 7-phosphate isomerase